ACALIPSPLLLQQARPRTRTSSRHRRKKQSGAASMARRPSWSVRSCSGATTASSRRSTGRANRDQAMARVKIIGGPASPYVRKVLAALAWKGIDYEIDPIVPFYGDDRFSKLSPLRRIPVLIDGDVALCDSSVILQYLEDRWPEKPIYPSD